MYLVVTKVYQGGTMGGLTAYTNSTNPTAAVPSNTALTCQLTKWSRWSGMGNIYIRSCSKYRWYSDDGYQVPAGTVNVPGKRLKITGVKMTSFVQTAMTGGPLVNTFALAFGHTAVSLATAEAAATKSLELFYYQNLLNP